MFLTLQFPLFDHRYMQPTPNRTERPNWPEPGGNDRLRYFGEIFNRTKPYLGPWDDEKKYCNARSVINLCGMGPGHFYKMLFKSPAQTRILFRRFQSDGKCMAKFELGLNDNFERSPALQQANAAAVAKALDEQIQQYLLCPVKIKIGNQLSHYTALADAGDELNSAYYWATQKGKKTFSLKDVQHQAESCEPVLLLQLDVSKIDVSGWQLQHVDVPGLLAEGMQLFCRYTPYRIGNRNYNLKTWVIATNNDHDKAAVMPGEFSAYNNTLRYLRINLLRIHVEIILQKKLLDVLSRASTATLLNDEATRNRLYQYLHKIWLNLSAIQRNKQPQQQLVQTAFTLDATHFASAGIDDQVALLADYKNWLQNMQPTFKNEQVKKYVAENAAELEQKKEAAATSLTVFISYNHADAVTAGALKKKLEENSIAVILDSASMPAGTKIEQFIKDSIKNSSATISIVSVHSLTSGWVSIETEKTLNFMDFFDDKKFIACYLDKEFFDITYVDKTSETIGERVKIIRALYKKYDKRNQPTTDLDAEKSRLLMLEKNLPHTVAYLRKIKCIDVRPEQFEASFPELLKALKN